MHSLKQEKTNLCTVFCACDVLNLSQGKVVRVEFKLQMPRYVQSFYFFFFSRPSLHNLAKQEMTLLPSFLFRRGIGMSLSNPIPSLRITILVLLPDKRASLPVLVLAALLRWR